MGVRKYRGKLVVDKRWPDGSRITRTCQNRTQAKELLARIEVSISDGSWQELKEDLRLRNRNSTTVTKFSEIYMEEYVFVRNKPNTYLRKRTSFSAINKFLGKTELEQLRPFHLHRYIQQQNKGGLSAASINRDLAAIKHMMTFAEKCGVVSWNPIARFKNLKEDLREGPRYSAQELDAVIDAVDPIASPLFIFLRETGCRREEALSLEHWQIQEGDGPGSVVFTGNTKSGKFRRVPLTESALKAVGALPRLDECPYVFYNPTTKTRWHDCRKQWEKARKKAGVPDLLVKDLRRHYAIRLAEGGATMHDIQQVLGHASVATTEKHYAQFSPEHSSKRIFEVLEGGRLQEETKRKRCLDEVEGNVVAM